MPYENKERPYKKEYKQQQARKSEHDRRMERQRARRKMDATSRDANGNGVADKREGKDPIFSKKLRQLNKKPPIPGR